MLIWDWQGMGSEIGGRLWEEDEFDEEPEPRRRGKRLNFGLGIENMVFGLLLGLYELCLLQMCRVKSCGLRGCRIWSPIIVRRWEKKDKVYRGTIDKVLV